MGYLVNFIAYGHVEANTKYIGLFGQTFMNRAST